MKDFLTDSFGRKIDYLRLSVTDRCNLRCAYCMPSEGVPQIKHKDILTYEEIIRSVKILAGLGIRKVRITGGEPLVRKGVISLIGSLNSIEGIEEVSLTTNGVLLKDCAGDLYAAGLSRINISLDTLDARKYRLLTRGGELKFVIDSIHSALRTGIRSVKINAVLSDFFDLEDAYDLIAFGKKEAIDIRFIEMMYPAFADTIDPLRNIECSTAFISPENKSGKSQRMVLKEDIFRIMKQFGNYHKVDEYKGCGPSVYYRIDGMASNVGFIINSKDICCSCNRARLTPDGLVRLCLFSNLELSLKDMLRADVTDEAIKEKLKDFIKIKPENRDAVCKSMGFKLSDYMNRIGG